MNRITALVAAAALASTLPIATSPSVHAGGAVTAFTVEMTVMIDDGTDTCAATNHAVSHNGSDTVRYCVTLTNTGSEALSLHDVQGDSIGQLVGPGDATVVEPGSSWSVTATALETEPHLEEVEWAATGVDSGVEVVEQASAYVYIQLLGAFPVQLDMTAIIDDGTDTCGTETDLAVPAGTPIRFCYTMTNTRDMPVEVTFLFDEHVGLVPGAAESGGVPLPKLEPDESRVVTNVAVVDESGTWTGHWAGIEDVSESIVQATDGVAIEVLEPAPTTTTTAPCVVATTSPPTTTPPTTSPATTTTTTSPPTTTTTTTPTTTSTTTTLPFGDPTTTTTTSPIIVIPTTTTTLGEPAGFARLAPAAVPCPETPPGGGTLPPTGSRSATAAALALGLIALGSIALITARWRRT